MFSSNSAYSLVFPADEPPLVNGKLRVPHAHPDGEPPAALPSASSSFRAGFSVESNMPPIKYPSSSLTIRQSQTTPEGRENLRGSRIPRSMLVLRVSIGACCLRSPLEPLAGSHRSWFRPNGRILADMCRSHPRGCCAPVISGLLTSTSLSIDCTQKSGIYAPWFP
jgi:hypothetical protein